MRNAKLIGVSSKEYLYGGLYVQVVIREAKPEEHEELTEISFAAKRYWNYPQEYFDVWKDELTISGDYVKNNAVFAAEAGGSLAAYYSIVEVKREFFAGETKVEKGILARAHVCYVKVHRLRHRQADVFPCKKSVPGNGG